ncbi:MAG: PspC domain-containing protein [Acidimicrobiia bacterium]|nr:PspC domain-containing protein [Acidimicrobiia bacterium]
MERTERQPALYRRSDDRILSGLAAGVAESVGVSPSYVRAAFVVLALAGGVGVVAYLIGVAMTVNTVDIGNKQIIGRSQKLGLALMLVAVLMTLRAANLWFGDSVVWPFGLIAFGLAAILDKGDNYSRLSSWMLPGGDASLRPPMSRMVVGTVVLFAGVATFVASRSALTTLGLPLLAVLVTAAGLMLLVGPWIVRLVGALNEERSDRIRSEERSDVAAHLHDSVLQTLALIQRSDDPNKMVTLARAQERELRQWLFEADPDVDSTLLSTALQSMAGRVERDYDIRVELVTVGEVQLNPTLDALVRAAGEATANAARHSGVQWVSVYAETADGQVDVFVSDQGSGFDVSTVNGDRHGIADSIIGRMERHGGTATVSSEIDGGTEVHLSMPLGSDK